MKLHTGDTVVVIAGKDKGKTGRILRVLPGADRIVVAGANMRVRHMRKTHQAPGRRVRYEASLHVSNVMLRDPKSNKRTRIGRRKGEGEKWERFAKSSGEALVSGKALKKLVEEVEKKEKEQLEKAVNEIQKAAKAKAKGKGKASNTSKKSS